MPMMFWVAPWIKLKTVLINSRAAELSQRRRLSHTLASRALADGAGAAGWSSLGARTGGVEIWTDWPGVNTREAVRLSRWAGVYHRRQYRPRFSG